MRLQAQLKRIKHETPIKKTKPRNEIVTNVKENHILRSITIPLLFSSCRILKFLKKEKLRNEILTINHVEYKIYGSMRFVHKFQNDEKKTISIYPKLSIYLQSCDRGFCKFDTRLTTQLTICN